MSLKDWLNGLFISYNTPEQKLSDKEVTNLILKAVNNSPLINDNYDMKNISIPASVYRDVLTGAQKMNYGVYSPDAFIPMALADRLSNRNVTERGQKSPTGADYFDLWNPDLVVPNKKDMSNYWE